MSYTIINDNNITHLKTIQDNTIDSIITDPPYGIEFLGKDWDSNTGAVETWQECLRVLKPGGYLLAFSAARTYHNLATNIESVGFEIRDQLMWLYSSGFPKAQDIGKSIQRRQGIEQTEEYKHNHPRVGGDGDGSAWQQNNIRGTTIPTSPQAQQWAGWKTALKPSHEPIVMARKPFKGSTIDCVLTHGVGALNIDATRIETDNIKAFRKERIRTSTREHNTVNQKTSVFGSFADKTGDEYTNTPQTDTEDLENLQGRFPSNVIGEVDGYQKYFYCPKVSRRERHVGFEQPNDTATLPNSGIKGDYFSNNISHNNPANKKDPLAHIPAPFGDVQGAYVDGERMAAVTDREGYANMGNNHPTVKPVALMRYLIKLVTPTNSHVLDPFCGSGSTGMAAVELGHTFTGIELNADYVEIAKRRIKGWNNPQETGNTYNELFEENK